MIYGLRHLRLRDYGIKRYRDWRVGVSMFTSSFFKGFGVFGIGGFMDILAFGDLEIQGY